MMKEWLVYMQWLGVDTVFLTLRQVGNNYIVQVADLANNYYWTEQYCYCSYNSAYAALIGVIKAEYELSGAEFGAIVVQ